MADDQVCKPVVVVVTLILLASVSCVEGGAAALFPYGPNNRDQAIDIGGSKEVSLPRFRFYGQEFTTAYSCGSRSTGDPTTNLDLDRLDMYVANASVAMKTFRSDFALFVTWENSNTFQLVLVANTQHTFAIFGYYKLDVPYSANQLAGMNGGYGRGWTDVIPCSVACARETKIIEGRIRNMINTSGSDVEGRYILLVSGDIIVRGGCLPSSLLKATGEVSPRAVGMLGGEMLLVSGSCQPPGSKIFCVLTTIRSYQWKSTPINLHGDWFVFHRYVSMERNSAAISEGVMETNMRGRCPVPMLNVRGRIRLDLSTDNRTWTHPTVITVVLPGRVKPVVDIGIVPAWQQLNPQELVVKWDPTLFSNNSLATPEFRPLVTIAERQRSSNSEYKFNPDTLSCSREDCDNSVLGVLKVTVLPDYIDAATQRQFVAFGPLPLGWYINSAMESKLGKDWPAQKCSAWSQEDGRQTGWLQQLLPCPCTLTQALADWGRWQPDNWVQHVCRKSEGAGNQCFYNKDGLLQYAADSYQGSTPDRSHSWGAAPYGKPNLVPDFSHWQHDVITFYYCCLWTNNRECDRYMERRPTRDCVDYKSPSYATAFGDPHIQTFDGTNYYFGGEGDFWLLQSSSVNIQAHFLPRSTEVLQLNSSFIYPTVIKSVAMQSTGSDRVVINLAQPTGCPTASSITAFLDAYLAVTISEHVPGVSVINNEPVAVDTKDRQHSNFTVLFKNGVGVQVAERQGMIHLTVALPPSSESTSGLLGTRDGNKANDFMTPDGQGMSVKMESLFHFPRNAESEKIPLFGTPSEFPYKPGQTKPSQYTVSSVCGNSEACKRDFYVTNNSSIARDTLQAEAAFQSLRQSQTEVLSCGLLDIPMAAKSSYNYLVGSEVRHHWLSAQQHQSRVQRPTTLRLQLQPPVDSIPRQEPLWLRPDEQEKPVPLRRTVGTGDTKVEPGTDEKLLRGLVNKSEGEPGPRQSVPV
ncbi:hypothetical protein C0Q70_06188 [Pomacea canaliculata]|uniref:AMOP domain-containing protein n=1 Tax=Pomacea canaliculata TaxID=400727 RepID=A0A2T7PNG6_POMCA|nr:hypothetical protein C0Q70_06188 [Pomacea canaliculata]